MSRTMRGVWIVSSLALGSLAIACAPDAPSDGSEDVAPEPGSVSGSQIIYSTNSAGTWSSNAWQPTLDGSLMTFGADFTGPSGATRKMGACLLQQYKPTTYYSNVPCSTVADCANAPGALLPAGGSRYCTSPDGVGQKTCWYRPGYASQYCVGSPAMAGNPAVGPGSYWNEIGLGNVEARASFISYGCFEGCSATDPSSSSSATVQCQNCQGYCCSL